MHENRLGLAELARDAFDGAVEIGETVGLVQLIETRPQMRLGVVRRAVTAQRQQATDRPRKMQLLLKPLDESRVRLEWQEPSRPRTSAHSGCGHDRKLSAVQITDNNHSDAY